MQVNVFLVYIEREGKMALLWHKRRHTYAIRSNNYNSLIILQLLDNIMH